MTVVAALLAELTDEDCALLAEKLWPLLADRLGGPADDCWLRGAKEIAAYLGCPRSRVFALSSVGSIPVEKDGSALIARKSVLDEWVRAGGAKRP